MNKLAFIGLIFFLFSCSEGHKSKSDNSTLKESDLAIAESPTVVEENIDDSLEEPEIIEEECIFDQDTQTDEFLKNIEEFAGYSWNNEEKTATIVLDNKDTLLITRGGCDSFGVTAEYYFYNDTTDYEDLSNVYNKLLWTAELLHNDFAFEELKNAIDSSQLNIDTYENTALISFKDEYLQFNNYEIERRIEKDMTLVSLSYYIN